MFDFPNNPVVNQSVTAPNGGFFIFDGVKWTNGAGPSPTLYIPISGGVMTGPLTLAANATLPMHAVPLQQVSTVAAGALTYTATGGNTPRAAQDRAAETIYAEDYGVVPNAADNTAPLQAFFARLQSKGGKGILPAGWINFTAPMTISGIQNWMLEGMGRSATWLVYTGADHTVDILKISGCANFTLRGFHLDSSVAMTAGTALHLYQSGHAFLYDIQAAGQSGLTHIGSDSNMHFNLWNGFWFDQVDMVVLSGFEAAAQNDGIRLNGTAGPGAKADLLVSLGKVMGAFIGVHVGGGFGGLLLDNVDVIANWHSFVIDQSLAAEFNREIFLGPHAVFDSSGALSSPTAPGPAAQSGVGDNVLINDPNGGFLVFKGWASAAGQNGNNIHIVGWGGTINIDGCLIPYAAADGIRIDTSVPTVIVTDGTQLHGNAGYGINQTVTMNPVIGSPVFNTNTLGNLSPTTKLMPTGAAVTAPLMDGAAAVGTSGSLARADHVHPRDINLVLQSPNDPTSMQTGAGAVGSFGATPHYVTAYGESAFQNLHDAAVNNTAFGSLAGFGITTGSTNAIFGAVACYQSSGTLSNTTAIGAIAGYTLTTGNGNTLIGVNAGNGLTTGSGNIFLGDGSGISFGSATESNTFRVGTSSVTLIRGTALNTAAPHLFLDWLPASTTYANDAAAATGGVPVGQLYRNGSAVMCRIA